RVYSNMYMFTAMFICLILGIAMSYLYLDGLRYTFLRYAVALAAFGAFCYVRRGDVSELLGYLKRRFIKRI
ncbi:MAG: hypothetical protein K6E98_03955, partial [Lachnospiraceae bacterium]|nr:hypothetical protein [Lachnospiraceae bacterium]